MTSNYRETEIRILRAIYRVLVLVVFGLLLIVVFKVIYSSGPVPTTIIPAESEPATEQERRVRAIVDRLIALSPPHGKNWKAVSRYDIPNSSDGGFYFEHNGTGIKVYARRGSRVFLAETWADLTSWASPNCIELEWSSEILRREKLEDGGSHYVREERDGRRLYTAIQLNREPTDEEMEKWRIERAQQEAQAVSRMLDKLPTPANEVEIH